MFLHETDDIILTYGLMFKTLEALSWFLLHMSGNAVHAYLPLCAFSIASG